MNKKIFVIVVLLCALVILGTNLYFSYQILDLQKIPMSVTIREGPVGLDTGTDMLTFGRISLEGVGERRITLSSPQDADFVIAAEGNLSPYVDILPSEGFLEANEKQVVRFVLTAPDEEGYYGGTAKIVLYRK